MNLVIFDIDGTLTNTKAIDDCCFINSVRECWGIDLGDVDWATFIHVTDCGLATDIFRSRFSEEISEKDILKLKNVFSAKIIAASNENPEAFLEVKGAADFIKELESQNFKIAIATGGWKVTAAHKLRKIGLELDCFPHATSDDHFSRKEILIRAIDKARERYQLNFDRIFYIGDGIWDYKAASELNIGFIGIDYSENGKLIEVGVSQVHTDYAKKDLIIDGIRKMAVV